MVDFEIIAVDLHLLLVAGPCLKVLGPGRGKFRHKCSGIFESVETVHSPLRQDLTLYHFQCLTPVLYNHRSYSKNHWHVANPVPCENSRDDESVGHQSNCCRAFLEHAVQNVGLTIIRRPLPSRSVFETGCYRRHCFPTYRSI